MQRSPLPQERHCRFDLHAPRACTVQRGENATVSREVHWRFVGSLYFLKRESAWRFRGRKSVFSSIAMSYPVICLMYALIA